MARLANNGRCLQNAERDLQILIASVTKLPVVGILVFHGGLSPLIQLIFLCCFVGYRLDCSLASFADAVLEVLVVPFSFLLVPRFRTT